MWICARIPYPSEKKAQLVSTQQSLTINSPCRSRSRAKENIAMTSPFRRRSVLKAKLTSPLVFLPSTQFTTSRKYLGSSNEARSRWHYRRPPRFAQIAQSQYRSLDYLILVKRASVIAHGIVCLVRSAVTVLSTTNKRRNGTNYLLLDALESREDKFDSRARAQRESTTGARTTERRERETNMGEGIYRQEVPGYA